MYKWTKIIVIPHFLHYPLLSASNSLFQTDLSLSLVSWDRVLLYSPTRGPTHNLPLSTQEYSGCRCTSHAWLLSVVFWLDVCGGRAWTWVPGNPRQVLFHWVACPAPVGTLWNWAKCWAYNFLYKRCIFSSDWRDASASQLLATQHEDLSSDSQHTCER